MARSGMASLITRLRLAIGDPSGDPVVYSAWQTVHAYAIGDTRRPSSANGHFYRAVVAGTSAVGEPTFPTNGGSVIDGTVVWEDEGAIPSGSSTFTDDELQGFLDNHRTEVRTVELDPIRSVAAGGATSYLEYRAPRGFWEDAPLLQSNSYATLSPAASDLVTGRWTFATNTLAPVFITGQCFDLWGAAVEALQAMSALVSREFDFATNNQSFSRSQKHAGILRQIAEYARRARPSGTRVVEDRYAW